MARRKKSGKGKATPGSYAPVIGCGLFVALVLAFLSWALAGVLNPR